MARVALGGWLIIGAVLMGGVLASALLGQPVRLDQPGDLIIVFGVLGGWGVGYAITAAIVVVDVVLLVRRGDLDALQRAANLIKLIAVPFFVLNFAALALLAGAATVLGFQDRAEFGLVGPVLAVVFVGLTFLVLLPTSAYGIGCLVLMKRDHTVGRVFFGVNLVLHLLFVLDILSMILVVETARHRLNSVRTPPPAARNLLTGVLAVCSVVAIVWLALLAIALGVDGAPEVIADVVGYGALALPLGLVLLVLVPVAPLVTFRTAVRLYLLSDLDLLRRGTRAVKIAGIPFFVQNFLVCALLVLAVTLLPVAASRGTIIFAGPLAIPIVGAFTSAGFVPAVLATYLMMLPTSCYGVACLAVLMRERAISPKFCALHMILHLVFIADIVSTFVVAHRAEQLAGDDRQDAV